MSAPRIDPADAMDDEFMWLHDASDSACRLNSLRPRINFTRVNVLLHGVETAVRIAQTYALSGSRAVDLAAHLLIEEGVRAEVTS